MVTKICIRDYVGDTNRHEKFYADRIRGFVFAIFFVFWFFQSPTAKTPALILTQNAQKTRLCERVCFRVAKPVFKILIPFFPTTVYFGVH